MTLRDPRRVAKLASLGSVHRAFHWLHLHEQQLRRWQLTFLGIPAPPFLEAGRAAWFLQRFEELGLQKAHIDSEGNVLAVRRGRHEGQQAVLLSAHLDTVFPLDVPCVPSEDGARICCPGACDNGAGLTALLALAAAMHFADLAPDCTVLFAANVGEEGEGNLRGMRHLLAHPPEDFEITTVMALEGAGTALVVDRALGSRRLRVQVTGAGGHSWADAHRPNPVLALSAALLAVARLPLPRQPRTVLNVGTFVGGTSVNSIPQQATAQLDLRSTSERELDRLETVVLATLSAEIAAETRNSAEGERLQLSVERIGARPVGALGRETELFGSLLAVDRHLGIATDFRIGSTDANLPLSLGIPALAIGTGGVGEALHSTAEWYDPTGRELALRRILLLLLDVCAGVAEQSLAGEDGNAHAR